MVQENSTSESAAEIQLRETVARVVAAKRRGSRGIVVGSWDDQPERQPGDEPQPVKPARTGGAGMSLPAWCQPAPLAELSASDVKRLAAGLLPSHGAGQGKTATDHVAAPGLTNRGASNSKSETGGIDWLSITFRVVHQNFAVLRGLLAAGKNDAQERKAESGGIVELPGGTLARVCRTGTKGYVHCKWSIEVDGILISFADREYPHETTPNVLATISGRICLERGYAWCSMRIDQILAEIGAEILSESISRLDICSDLVDVGVLQFFHAWMEERHITRATKFSLHGERDLNGAQTFSLGSRGAICCRMYDKLAEVAGDVDRMELMRVHRWDGVIPDRATRVEFECHTDFLRELQIVTRADLFEGLPRLVKYLTHDWLRFAEGVVDRTNTSREKTAVFWEKVIEHFAAWVGTCCTVPVERQKPRPVQKPQLEKQAMGCIASAIAGRIADVDSPKKAALMLLQKCLEYSEYLQERLIDRGIGMIFKLGDHSWQETLEHQLHIWWQTDSGIRPMSPATWGH